MTRRKKGKDEISQGVRRKQSKGYHLHSTGRQNGAAVMNNLPVLREIEYVHIARPQVVTYP